ncbi:MAG: ribosome-binding factor A [Patescibacteria group bacterium]|nr:ribosome-binding factor A [Patescibacteria group bacterium]
MSHHRQEKLDQIFLEELNQAIKQVVEFDEGIFVTLVGIKVAENLQSARILVSCLPFEKSSAALKTLQIHHQDLIEYLNRRVSFRKIPKLIFEIDDTEEKAEGIERLIGGLEIKE